MSDQSFPAVVKYLYNRTIRSLLPRKLGVYSGVVARQPRLLDATDHHPGYKKGLMTAIEESVADRDVVLIGMGRGISTIKCIQSGAKSVVAYEAATEMLTRARETLDLNLTDREERKITIKHAIVGKEIDVYGSPSGASKVLPSELPRADVLVLDCEGAETSILEGINQYPETVVVETHPYHGAPSNQTTSQLNSLGYDVYEYTHEPGEDHPEKMVLRGERNDS